MNSITIIQSILAILLIIAILLQQRGAGIGGAMGGGGADSSFSTRRGTEKTIFRATIVLAIVFFAISVARLLL